MTGCPPQRYVPGNRQEWYQRFHSCRHGTFTLTASSRHCTRSPIARGRSGACRPMEAYHSGRKGRSRTATQGQLSTGKDTRTVQRPLLRSDHDVSRTNRATRPQVAARQGTATFTGPTSPRRPWSSSTGRSGGACPSATTSASRVDGTGDRMDADTRRQQSCPFRRAPSPTRPTRAARQVEGAGQHG